MSDKQDSKGKVPGTALDLYRGDKLDAIIPQEWLEGRAQGAMRTSLNRNTKEGRLAILKALDGEIQGLEQVLNTQLALVGLTIHPVSFPDDETGETIHAVRMILHCADGASYACVSQGALKSAGLICSVYGPPPWDKPVIVKPRRLPTSGGKSRYMLEVSE